VPGGWSAGTRTQVAHLDCLVPPKPRTHTPNWFHTGHHPARGYRHVPQQRRHAPNPALGHVERPGVVDSCRPRGGRRADGGGAERRARRQKGDEASDGKSGKRFRGGVTATLGCSAVVVGEVVFVNGIGSGTRLVEGKPA